MILSSAASCSRPTPRSISDTRVVLRPVATETSRIRRPSWYLSNRISLAGLDVFTRGGNQALRRRSSEEKSLIMKPTDFGANPLKMIGRTRFKPSGESERESKRLHFPRSAPLVTTVFSEGKLRESSDCSRRRKTCLQVNIVDILCETKCGSRLGLGLLRFFLPPQARSSTLSLFSLHRFRAHSVPFGQHKMRSRLGPKAGLRVGSINKTPHAPVRRQLCLGCLHLHCPQTGCGKPAKCHGHLSRVRSILMPNRWHAKRIDQIVIDRP